MSDALLHTIIYIATALYAVAFVLYLCKRRGGAVAWLLAELCSITLVINNFVVNEYVPFVSMYQVLTFASAVFGGVYLYMAYLRDGKWTAPYIIGCSLVISLGLCFMDIEAVWHFPPALRSVYFIPHILMYVIAYIMAAAAFAMAVVKLCVRDVSRRKQLDGGIYDCVCVLFPCMTAGMLLGAVWANEVWGAFWSFDIKECWALTTWLLYMTWLHFKRTERSRDILIFVGFISVIVTFFFVNGMTAASSSLHTYSL